MGMTINKLAMAFRIAMEHGGEPLADAVLAEAVRGYGEDFATDALKQFEQIIDGERVAQEREYRRLNT